MRTDPELFLTAGVFVLVRGAFKTRAARRPVLVQIGKAYPTGAPATGRRVPSSGMEAARFCEGKFLRSPDAGHQKSRPSAGRLCTVNPRRG